MSGGSLPRARIARCASVASVGGTRPPAKQNTKKTQDLCRSLYSTTARSAYPHRAVSAPSAPSATVAAVEVRNTVGPNRTQRAPASTNVARSSGATPPSGPTTSRSSPSCRTRGGTPFRQRLGTPGAVVPTRHAASGPPRHDGIDSGLGGRLHRQLPAVAFRQGLRDRDPKRRSGHVACRLHPQFHGGVPTRMHGMGHAVGQSATTVGQRQPFTLPEPAHGDGVVCLLALEHRETGVGQRRHEEHGGCRVYHDCRPTRMSSALRAQLGEQTTLFVTVARQTRGLLTP